MESNAQNTPTPEETPTPPVETVETTTPPAQATTPPAPAVSGATPPPSEPNLFEKYLARFRAWVDENPKRAAIWGGVIVLLILSLIIRAPSPHVALSGEPLMPGGWFSNTLLTTLLVDIVILVLAYLAGSNMKLVPSGLQNAMEALLEYLFNLAESVAGHRATTFFPWAATVFLFVLVSNYFGLLPGVGSIGFYHIEEHASAPLAGQLAMADGKLLLAEEGEADHGEGDHGEEEGHGPHFVPLFRAPSADLNVTFALAIATMVMVQVQGVRALGAGYFRKFWNPSGQGFMKGINIFVGILEAVSEVSRILSFAFRLFGNIFAGEVVLATVAFLVTFLIPIPFYALEILVGAVQALVFAMLALVFFTMATISHGHDDHHAEGHH
jgi:F-type H+-transporting ATPase subunit a